MRMKMAVAAVGLVVLLGGVVLGAQPAGYAIVRSVVSGGGAHVEVEGYSLDCTSGQPVAAVNSEGGYVLSSGFWGGGVSQTLARVCLSLTARADCPAFLQWLGWVMT